MLRPHGIIEWSRCIYTVVTYWQNKMEHAQMRDRKCESASTVSNTENLQEGRHRDDVSSLSNHNLGLPHKHGVFSMKSLKLGLLLYVYAAFVLHLHCVSGKCLCSPLAFHGTFDAFAFITSLTIVNWS